MPATASNPFAVALPAPLRCSARRFTPFAPGWHGGARPPVPASHRIVRIGCCTLRAPGSARPDTPSTPCLRARAESVAAAMAAQSPFHALPVNTAPGIAKPPATLKYACSALSSIGWYPPGAARIHQVSWCNQPCGQNRRKPVNPSLSPAD